MWRCRAGCCRSRRRECPAQWLSAGRAWWGPVAACIWERVSGPQLAVKGSSPAGCCSGSPLNGSTSWFCELQKKNKHVSLRDSLKPRKMKGHSLRFTFQVHAGHQTLAEAACWAVFPPYLVYNAVVPSSAQVIMLA